MGENSGTYTGIKQTVGGLLLLHSNSNAKVAGCLKTSAEYEAAPLSIS